MYGLMEDGVGGELLAYGSLLVVAACGNLVGDDGKNVVFVTDEIGGEVWLDFVFESRKFVAGNVEVALAACHFAKEFDDFVGTAVVLEVVLLDIMAEVVVGAV